MIFQKILTESAKTEFFISIFEHGVDTYQVVKYLLSQNPGVTKKNGTPIDENVVKIAALVHDVGKLKKDFKSNGNREQWRHSPYTREFLLPLLQEQSFLRIIRENNLYVPVDIEDLVTICEKHHAMDAPLLRDYPEAVLVAVGDALASMIESGVTGNLSDLLKRYPYTQVTFAELKAFGFEKGLDAEVHRLDLPCTLSEDVFLATMIFEAWRSHFLNKGIAPLQQRKSCLWVIGPKENIIDTIEEILFRDSARAAFEKVGFSMKELESIFYGKAGIETKISFMGKEGNQYLITGSNAAYQYHRWRSPKPDTYFLKVRPEEVNFWYAVMRDSKTYISDKMPGRKDVRGYENIIILEPSLNEGLIHRKKVIADLDYLSPEDLISDILLKAEEGQISEAIAVIYCQSSNLDWKFLMTRVIEIDRQKTFLGILSGINKATNGAFFDTIPKEIETLTREIVPPEMVKIITRKIIEDVGEI